MNETFKELIEPIELIGPLGFESEVSSITNPVVTCDKGWVCEKGKAEI